MNNLKEVQAVLHISSITSEQVPSCAMERFEFYSSRFILPKEYEPGNFEGFWEMKTAQGNLYITKQRKPQNTEHSLYVYQLDTDGNPLGYAEIGELEQEKQEFTWLYYIGAIQYEQGFAKKILPILGALSEFFFGKPLNSTKTFVTQLDSKRPGETIRPILNLFERLLINGIVIRNPDSTFTFVREKVAAIVAQ